LDVVVEGDHRVLLPSQKTGGGRHAGPGRVKDAAAGRGGAGFVARPRYTLDELLGQCNASAELTAEDREWLDTKPVGSELL
jgi:hypothetical protein